MSTFQQSENPSAAAQSSGSSAKSLEPALIEQRKQAQSAVRSQFGPTVASAITSYLGDIMRSEQRAVLNPQEVAALSVIAQLAKDLSEVRTATLVGHTLPTLLNDVFRSAVERNHGKTAQEILVRATTCPDYAYDPATESYLTTGGIGSGIGLCATLMIKKGSALLQALHRTGVPVTLDLCFADIEANDPHMLKKAGISIDEFKARVHQSAQVATDFALKELAEQGIGCFVRATQMSALLEKLEKPLSGSDIPRDRRGGIVSTRISFYRRFFEDQLRRAVDPDAFFHARAEKDILDHVNVGRAIEQERERGARAVLLTLSTPALANFFNFENGGNYVPVVRLAQSY